MTFEEIFNEKGQYVADGFSEGVCLEVGYNNILFLIEYKDKDDLFPVKSSAIVFKELFKKDYRKVFTRQSLFENK